MSGKINLLPHREERRKRARVHFGVMGGMTALLGIVIVAAGWLVLSQRINAQEAPLLLIACGLALRSFE